MAFSIEKANALFKNKYEKISKDTYNSANVLLGRAKKYYNFVGKRMDIAIPTAFAGGVGSGTLPTANRAGYEDAIITSKKVYSTIKVDRESIAAASTDEGAFVRLTKEAAKRGVDSFNRNMSRILFGDGSGALGTGDGSTNVTGLGTEASPFVVVISTATWKEANWEERDYVNYASETSLLEVVEVIPASKTVKLVIVSGTTAIVAAAPISGIFYMQGSKDNDPEGLKGVLDATSGSKYSVTVGRRWQAYQKAAGGAGLTVDIMNENMLEVERRCGKTPNLIVMGYLQYRKFLNLLEDQKEYMVDPRSSDLKGKVSFRGIEFMSSAGAVPVFVDRFVENDRIYFLNDNFLEIYHRPGSPSWADDDGTVFLRTSADEYEARYAAYLQVMIYPPFHGVCSGLST